MADVKAKFVCGKRVGSGFPTLIPLAIVSRIEAVPKHGGGVTYSVYTVLGRDERVYDLRDLGIIDEELAIHL